METLNGIEIVAFEDAGQWESWLADHAGTSSGAWLKIAKKGTGAVSVSRGEALDVALCSGWIDSQARSHDESYYLQKFTPRRPRSVWSKVNIAKADALIAAGRMRPRGLEEIAKAKADGRWDAAYESQRNATVPPDLAAALAENPRAGDFFDTLGRSDRYAVLVRLMTAATPETRAARLQRMVAALEAGDKVG